jgi:hypothetical protein
VIAPASGRLLGLIAADLPDHSPIGKADGLTVFVAVDGTELVVGSRVKKRFLGRTETAVFQASTHAPGRGPALLQVRQTGVLRRRAVETRVSAGEADAARIAATIAGDQSFQSAAARLDFRRFEIELDRDACTATIELVGASMVAIALPPIRSYVRLHADQRSALLDSLHALRRVVAP